MGIDAARETERPAAGAPDVSPGRDEFVALDGFTHALVSTEVSSDLETPVSAFMKLRGESDEPCFMLKSAESGRTTLSWTGRSSRRRARQRSGRARPPGACSSSQLKLAGEPTSPFS
jgi:hypothetical protein